MDAPALEALRARLAAAGQAHLLEDWDALEPAARTALLAELAAVDFAHLGRVFADSLAAAAAPTRPAEPATGVATLASATAEQRAAWRAAGLRALSDGRLAALLLAGGQGTRLGSSAPKGCYDVGLPSSKSLFQLQAERLLRLEVLAAAATGAPRRPVRWYIMTSPATDAPTRAFFEEKAYFGLKRAQVFFFAQGQLPALDASGAAIAAAPGRLALSPDGNGGVYRALARSGALADMAAAGVAALDAVSVDNALARVCDPVFAGFCEAQDAQAAAKVVRKARPEEAVGVFARRGGRLEVVEYSELDPAEAAASDPATGELRFGWSNVCMHYFSRAWLEEVAARLDAGGLPYHVARKAIPSKDGTKVPGVKLELFIFDAFVWAERFALLEAARAEEFAPVKNAPGAATDSPDTARAAVLALGAAWVAAAGGAVTAPCGVEVSPLASYAGEGLEGVAAGATFPDALDARLQGAP
jgi:UDP-N-acetylglucosamine/UDP-N-acetylgalactosamine diphosphorylase